MECGVVGSNPPSDQVSSRNAELVLHGETTVAVTNGEAQFHGISVQVLTLTLTLTVTLTLTHVSLSSRCRHRRLPCYDPNPKCVPSSQTQPSSLLGGPASPVPDTPPPHYGPSLRPSLEAQLLSFSVCIFASPSWWPTSLTPKSDPFS